MEELRQTIQEHGIRYQLEGDYYLPVLELPEENRPIGRWGRLHKTYLKSHRPVLYQSLLLSGKLCTVLADLNEQAMERCSCIIRQMAEAEGITEELKAPVQIVRTVQKSPKCRVNRIQQEWRSVSGATPVFVWIRSWL